MSSSPTKTEKMETTENDEGDDDTTPAPQEAEESVVGGEEDAAEDVPDKMSFREAAIFVLRKAGKPMTAKEITKSIQERDLIVSEGKTPERTIAALMYSEIKAKGANSAFKLSARGYFGLSEFTQEQHNNVANAAQPKQKRKSEGEARGAPKKKKKRKVKVAAADEYDSEVTDESSEDERPKKKKKTPAKKDDKKQAASSTNAATTTTTTTTTTPSSTPAKPKPQPPARNMINTPIKQQARDPTARKIAGATTTTTTTLAANDDEYNDDYGYMYLKYFLELTRRQDKTDMSPEDDCFICKNGGDLICCDFPSCCKVYHLTCLNMEKVPEGRWYCPWHTCVTCESHKVSKASAYQCATCTNAYCEDHLPKEDIKTIRKDYIICKNCMKYFSAEIDQDEQ